MSETIEDGEIVTIEAPFPKIAAVSARDFLRIAVTWTGGAPVVIDLAPTLFTFKIYAPLRDDRALFRTVHVVNESVIAWGADDAIDMHVSEIERLAGEAMEAADFQAFLEQTSLTWEGAAAQLGISRRMIGYYVKGHPVPRYIALACAQVVARQRQGTTGSRPRAT